MELHPYWKPPVCIRKLRGELACPTCPMLREFTIQRLLHIYNGWAAGFAEATDPLDWCLYFTKASSVLEAMKMMKAPKLRSLLSK